MSGDTCVSKIEAKNLPQGTFPGRLPLDDFRVCIAQGAHAAIQTHAKSSLDAEVCGVMLGQLKKDAAGTFLLIEDVIEGQQAQGAEARVTFTPDAWDYIFKEQERRDPNLKMVGWYHTHPRFGIFLSRYDKFIHENFFAVEPWMVAYVVDPVADEEGFFFWNRGNSPRLDRYWIGDQPRRSDGAEFDDRDLADDRVPPPAATPAAPPRSPTHAPSALGLSSTPEGDGLLSWGLLAAVGLLALLLFGWTLFSPRDRRTAEDIREVRLMQQNLLLHQADLARELAEMRALQGFPPSTRKSLVEMERMLRQRLERPRRTGTAAPDSSTHARDDEASE